MNSNAKINGLCLGLPALEKKTSAEQGMTNIHKKVSYKFLVKVSKRAAQASFFLQHEQKHYNFGHRYK